MATAIRISRADERHGIFVREFVAVSFEVPSPFRPDVQRAISFNFLYPRALATRQPISIVATAATAMSADATRTVGDAKSNIQKRRLHGTANAATPREEMSIMRTVRHLE